MADYEKMETKKLMHNERIHKIRLEMLIDKVSSEITLRYMEYYESNQSLNRVFEFVSSSWNDLIIETPCGNIFPITKIERFYDMWNIVKDREYYY